MCDKSTSKAGDKSGLAIERARQNVIATARVIAEADYGRTYPDLHRAFARLDRACKR